MKKILFLIISAVLALTATTVFADDGALAYAESAPGGEVSSVEELIDAFGESSYGGANAELLPGSESEIRLKNSIILQSTIIIKKGEYTIVGGGCTFARSDSCGTAIDVQGGNLSIERADVSAEFGESTSPNIIFNGRGKEGKPFITVSAGASFKLNSRVLVKDMLSSENGAFISAHGDAEISIYASRFENCKAVNGGAVYVSEGTDSKKRTLTVEKSTFKLCSAENGGAIYSDAYTYIANSTLDENTASASGGAMYLGGSSELQSVSADKNKAKNGAVLFNEGASVMVSPEAFNNQAENGGVIFNKNSCLVSEVTFFENKASDCGGAVYNEGAFFINGGTIMANESVRYGGGIYSTEGSVLKIENGDISSGKAEYAGGVYSAGELIMTGGGIGKNYGSAPHLAVLGKLEMGGGASCYGGDVIGLVRKSDGEYPKIILKTALSSKNYQRVALYKLSNGDFKRANASGVTIFEGSEEALASAFKQFNAYSGGVFPFELAENGKMRRAFPTVFVIVTVSAVTVGAVGFVVGKKVVQVNKEKKREP